MTLAALRHLIRSASALAGDRKFLVLGSASLLVSFPELGEPSSPLAATYDADLCPEPFDERTGCQVVERSAWFGIAGMLVNPESFGHIPDRAGVWLRFPR
jgi:hypothetical protein